MAIAVTQVAYATGLMYSVTVRLDLQNSPWLIVGQFEQLTCSTVVVLVVVLLLVV